LIELIIIDDNSKEDIKTFLQEFIHQGQLGNLNNIVYVKNKENKGFPHNANIILDEASHDIVCILNSDTYVCEGALEKISKVLEDNDNILVA
jgi:GT2 family glycosyltransferase